jgi:magnesium-transporting ATPase (P-type)
MKLPESIGGGLIPLSNDNVMLRGMSLRNTPSVYGVVLYTGHQTKIQMNSSTAKYKSSKVMD